MEMRRGVWLVWSVGVLAYLVAVLQRSSFGVAGLAAMDRFHASPAMLSTFVVLQLLVYTCMQVPVGMLLDRFGPRTLILVGAVTMAAGQLLLAFAVGLPFAVLARVLVGLGDALTFISVLRVVSAWFSPRRAPLMTQLTALLGQLGQVLSAIPLAALLNNSGWTTAFASAGGLGVLVTVLVLVVVRDRPSGAHAPSAPPSLAQVSRGLKDAWRTPGTQLGLWSHMGTQFSGTVFALLWGVPFLVAGQGLSPGQASALLTVFVLVGIVAGPLVGELTARYPMRRSWLVLSIIAANALVWTVVLALPQPVPHWLLVVLVAVIAVGAPGSVIGFDYARTFNPGDRQGTAVGIVNVGGFSASVVVVFAIGVVLSLVGGPDGYSAADFRIAWCSQYVIWAIAVVGVLRARRSTRRVMARDGIVVLPLRVALARRRERSAETVS
ncbi:MFS transporter [Pseudonocardia spinosispora]|uniref:MFS transporter n=1 Tax=Pseudonocardia spinosispora TaxID=103441 RepID=UPI0003F82173|nr:MFS transporter [Pseudonocardia spinosispora]